MKIYRIALFSLIWTMVWTLSPGLPAFAIQEGLNNFNVETVKTVEEGTISNIAKEDLLRRLQHGLHKTTDSRLDKELMDLETGFSSFAEDATIDLILKDTDVASILRIIAKEGGMNVVIDESVMGVITAELKNISLNEAMQTILTSEELEARVSNNTIFVASRPVMAKKGLNRRYIKTFKLNNSNPVFVADILRASIFNKGYKVNETTAEGTALQAVPATPAAPGLGEPSGSSTGQSSLIDSKVIKGKIEQLETGENFGDADKLASEIKVQHYTAKTGNITIENNDGGAIVIPDTRTNSILVAGMKRDILLAEESIKYLDKPLKQVSIEVSLIELSKDNSKDLGLYTSLQGGKVSGGFNAVQGEFSGYDFSSLANQSGITLNTISSMADEVAMKLKALITNEEAKLLANPKVIALNGSEALIKITEQVVSSVETTITDTAVTYNAELSDVGIVLNLLPKIGSDDYVTMRIRPSITSALPEVLIGEFQNGGAAIKVTPISTREVILQDVRIKSGETLAIAGLTKEQDITKEGKVPFLGDIPLFGKLFRNKEFDHEKNELIILIKPIIIDDIASNSL